VFVPCEQRDGCDERDEEARREEKTVELSSADIHYRIVSSSTLRIRRHLSLAVKHLSGKLSLLEPAKSKPADDVVVLWGSFLHLHSSWHY